MQRNLKKMERKTSFKENFVRKLILSNPHYFIGLQFDHQDRALQKKKKKKEQKNREQGCP